MIDIVRDNFTGGAKKGNSGTGLKKAPE